MSKKQVICELADNCVADIEFDVICCHKKLHYYCPMCDSVYCFAIKEDVFKKVKCIEVGEK